MLHLRDVPATSELARNALSVAREYFMNLTTEAPEPLSAKLNGAFDADALEATLGEPSVALRSSTDVWLHSILLRGQA